MASSHRPRVFLDANLLFSSVYARSRIPAELVRRAVAGEFQAVISRPVLREVARNLHDKAPRALPGLERLLTHGAFEIVAEPHAALVERLIDLREDAPIVAAALEAKSDILCTGDVQLRSRTGALALSLKVLSPRQLLDFLTHAVPYP